MLRSINNSELKAALFLFTLSLIIRVIFLVPFTINDIPLMTDENEYFDRAIGYENILSDLSKGQTPSSETRQRAYGQGMWPPFHPFLLGLVTFLFGKHIIVMRMLMVLLSAITTSVIYLLTSRLITGRSAFAAAVFHTFYASYIGYSHYILSETTYILFLVSAVYFTVLIFDLPEQNKRILYAVLSGVFLGLCGITRPAVLPFLVIIPFWLFIFTKGTRAKILLSSIIVLSYIVVLSPWQAYLIKNEKDPGLLSNITGWYIHIGNNPWIPEGHGTSWQHDSRGLMVKAAQEYSRANPGVGFDQSQRILAIEEIKKDFKAFIVRGFYKLRMFWSMDFYVLIHLFYAAYPPVHPAVAAFIWIIILISYISILILAVFGLLDRETSFAKRCLILLMVLGGTAPSFVAFGISRFHLPLFALLLPYAGHGAVNLNQSLSWPCRTILSLMTALILFTVFTSLPLVLEVYLKPSSHYCSLIGKVDKIFGTETNCVDKIIFRTVNNENDALNLTINSKGYGFNLTQKDMWTRVPAIQEHTWIISNETRILRLDVYASETSAPLEMTVTSAQLRKSAVIEPIRMRSWRKWTPSGIKGIEYMWLGGGMGVRNKLPEDKLYQFR